MTVSFGIEFEFDVIDRHGNRVSHNCEFHSHLAPDWGYQEDATATVEFRSPVFTSLERAVESIREQFASWCENFRDLSPYPLSIHGRSLGQHMHIGLPNAALSRPSKKRIALAVLPIYPLLAAIHAQPIPSSRGLRSQYCYPIVNSHEFRYWDRVPTDHYAEISDSSHGTVEFRLFDSNIPQVSLTCAWILTKIAEKALRSREGESSGFSENEYMRDRTNALTHGLSALNVVEGLRYIKNVVRDGTLPDIDCIRELLFIGARYGLNAYQVYSMVRANPFSYFRVMFSNPDKFLENLLSLEGIRHIDRLERWLHLSRQVRSLDELIGIAIASLEALRQIASAPEAAIGARNRAISRAYVRECIANNNYSIARINEVPRLGHQSVAERISQLLQRHGEGMVRVRSAYDIINDRARYYVMYVYDGNSDSVEILGCISVDRNSGEIGHLVVDRRFRGLGIGRILVRHAIEFLRSINGPRPWAYVKRDNEVSRRLFEELGFVVSAEDDHGLIMVLENRGE